MGFNLTFKSPQTNRTCKYAKIVGGIFDDVQGVAIINLGYYSSKTDRAAGITPDWIEQVDIPLTDQEGLTKAQQYVLLQTYLTDKKQTFTNDI